MTTANTPIDPDDPTPSSKVTAIGLAGFIISFVSTIGSRVFGVEIDLDPDVAFWLASGILLVVGWFKAENKPSPSAVQSVLKNRR